MPSISPQYTLAKRSWIAAFDYQEQHAGKKVRAALTRALATVFQIDSQQSKIISRCVERKNTASLIHDDIVDEDQIRRGAPAVWVKFGVDTALISGMYGYIKGLQLLAELDDVNLLRASLRSLEELHVGQHIDTQISKGSLLPTFEEYRFIAQSNTGCFFTFILQACQQLKPLPQGSYSALMQMLLELAVYYRLVNDYCDINHKPHFDRKGFATDLEGGPKSFLMILAGRCLLKKPRSKKRKDAIILEWGNAGVFDKALATMDASYAQLTQHYERAQRKCNQRNFSALRRFLKNIHFQQSVDDNYYEWLKKQ